MSDSIEMAAPTLPEFLQSLSLMFKEYAQNIENIKKHQENQIQATARHQFPLHITLRGQEKSCKKRQDQLEKAIFSLWQKYLQRLIREEQGDNLKRGKIGKHRARKLLREIDAYLDEEAFSAAAPKVFTKILTQIWAASSALTVTTREERSSTLLKNHPELFRGDRRDLSARVAKTLLDYL